MAGLLWGSRQGVQFALTLVVLKALPVLIIGGFTSIAGAIVGGLIVGAGDSLAEIYLGAPARGQRVDLVRLCARGGLPAHPAGRPVRRTRHRKDLIHDVNKFRRGRGLHPSARAPSAAQPSMDGFAIAALAAFAGVPLVANDYWLNAILIPFLILSLAGLGLNLLMGYAGQASLGTGGLMSVGAYATYNLLLRLPELPLPVSLMLGGVIAGLVGLAAGLLSLRIKGLSRRLDPCDAVLSGVALQPVRLVLELLDVQLDIRATSGHPWSRPPGPCRPLPSDSVGGHDSHGGRHPSVHSQTGRTWMAIRDMDTAAAVIGIPVASGKLKAFFVSSLVIGIAGALWAFAYLGTVDARSFNLDRSFEVMFIIILGGMGSIVGNYLGAAFMILLPILLDHVVSGSLGGAIDAGQLENFQKALFGGLIIWFLIKEPNGLAALLSRGRQWLTRRTAP